MVLTGAGLSAESNIPTFRDNKDGLWVDNDPMVVANYKVWRQNFDLIHKFHNKVRAELSNKIPNKAHFKLAEWQQKYGAIVFTQNVDLLCEDAVLFNSYFVLLL